MPVNAGWSTPLLLVENVPRSIAFYRDLGFELIDDDARDGEPPGWARMHCQGGAVMFLATEDSSPPRSAHERFMLTMYTPDLPALREQLMARSVEVTEIKRPPYMPSGEAYLYDPDRYRIHLCHWGKEEDEQWERHLEERKRQRANE